MQESSKANSTLNKYLLHSKYTVQMRGAGGIPLI